MNKLTVMIVGAILSMTITAEEDKGIIGRVSEDGLPVIYKFVDELPSDLIRENLTWLLVISWEYDGSLNNGMPSESENREMIILEDVIQQQIANDEVLRHVYSRTGNNLKELVYYVHEQEQFLKSFNTVLSDHPRYPIEINFYQDTDWKDFTKLLTDFSK